ncbi:cytochrome c-type biogenesis protein CcmH [Duganella sp. CF402]|uniref:c-type cytochrome biogenesis protein CcmI n=1 Tax=unclassified Duganella TaxID=2636909 RepID=UPI0008AD41EC|nr:MULTISPECIES: c-type cytochrome biogenesis protein CcmI [unclassified Duganella]RZT06286.1 cytochrome c-type biogenesis protein CcmH [Duganella sp. BK701]SEM69099.1 cytochrome c-type biogenesis protein CcmH [Duganella sp. CF402]
MNGFVFAAAVMCVLVLWLVLRPLLSRRDAGAAPQADQLNLAVLRDQLRELEADREQGSIDAEAYTAARRDLEQRVAEDVHPAATPAVAGAVPVARWQAVALALVLIAGSGVLYATLGTPQALVAPGAAPAAAGQALDPHTSSEAEAMVAKLADRMAREPNDPNGWALLARSYSAMGRFVAASGAYQRLVALIADDAQILSDYADVLAMTQNQKLRGEPERLLARALAADPKNVKALILSGDAAFERTDLASAAVHWQAALANATPGSEFAQMARDNLAHIGAPVEGASAAPSPAAASSATAVSGRVELDPALRAQVADTDTVFIVAKAADGPRFPLAVLRKQVRELPLQFTLDDTMGMMPGVKLSQFPQLVVTARISKSGNAIAAPGDLESAPHAAKPGDAQIQLRISPK